MSALAPERALISAVIRTQEYRTLIEQKINPDFFVGYVEEAEWLFKYIDRNKRAPSKTLFRAEFPEFRFYAVDDVTHYCDEVRQAHAAHKLTATMSQAADALRGKKIEKAMDILQRGMVSTFSVAKLHDDTDIIDDWEALVDDVAARKERYDRDGFAGIPTGFKTVDAVTGGLQGGQLGVLAARLGHGKSWSLLRMATTAVMRGHVVQFNALEMHRKEVSKRFHTYISSEVGRQIFSSAKIFNNTSLSQGKDVNVEDYRKFCSQLRRELNKNSRFHVSDSSRGQIGVMDIESQIVRNRPDIVFIDYITLMKTSGVGDWSSIAKLTNELKQLALTYDIPIMVAAQFNRNGAGGEGLPGPEDLARGDSIGQDADIVLSQRLITNHALAGQCVKNRHGMGNFKFYCSFDPDRGQLLEVSKQIWDDIKEADQLDARP